jgi:hypothetical protein
MGGEEDDPAEHAPRAKSPQVRHDSHLTTFIGIFSPFPFFFSFRNTPRTLLCAFGPKTKNREWFPTPGRGF